MIRSTFVALLCACIASGVGDSPAPANDVEHNVARGQEFLVFNRDYQRLWSEHVAHLHVLHEKVIAREASRQSTACSHQILTELKFLLMGSANFDVIDHRIRDLESSLAQPEREKTAERQDPADGSWGACYDAWYLKLEASSDHIDEEGLQPFRFLDQVNSPEKLSNYLTSVATSDVARTGVDHLLEFNLSLTNLLRLIVRGLPKEYPWDPRLKRTVTDLVLHRLRNSSTGWWGESYVRGGQVKFVDDLSTTFHVVSYLKGEVSGLQKILDTTLAVKSLDFPVGWLWKGQYWNHNNMDVAVLAAYAWPHATATQRRTISAELDKMLQWCLRESLQPDGSFKPLVPDLSIEEANYFGVAFLTRVGYFDPSRRFWTDREFPESETVRQRIVANLNTFKGSGGAGGAYYRSILKELN